MFVCEGLSNDDVGVARGAPYCRIYGWELASKPAISLQKRWGGTVVRLTLKGYSASFTPTDPWNSFGGFRGTVALGPHLSTGTCRIAAVAVGAVQPAVDYGFGPGRVSRLPSSLFNPPSRVPRARPRLWPSLRTHLGPQLLSLRYPSHPTVAERSL